MDPWYRIGMYVKTATGQQLLCQVGRSKSFDKADDRCRNINDKLADLGLLTYEDEDHNTWSVEVGRTFAAFY